MEERTKVNYNELNTSEDAAKPMQDPAPPKIETEKAVVDVPKLYLRKEPKRGETVCVLKRGDVLDVSASPSKAWVAATTKEGDKGFVMKRFLKAK